MNAKLVIAIAILVIVVALGALLIVIPGLNNGGTAGPFVSANVRVSLPYPNATVVKEFTARGEARGNWYFEASFPVEVRDPNGKVVGRGIAQAEGEWMTTDFVPFSAPIKIEDHAGPATIYFIKDNPSGLPEHDDSVSFPITVQ